ncbi:MAG TPA: hypothetical protein VFI40_04865 [Nocardioides sp.]|nr:hypothetical protein [Nocardioides sp.]
MRLPRRVKTVIITPPDEAPEMDPNLLLLDGRDIRSVNRHERRSHGFSGPAFTQASPTLTRFVRRHSAALLDEAPSKTRRQRRAKARATRALQRRGLL